MICSFHVIFFSSSLPLIILMIIEKKMNVCTGGWQEDNDSFLINNRNKIPFDSTLYVAFCSSFSYQQSFLLRLLFEAEEETTATWLRLKNVHVQTICFSLLFSNFNKVKESRRRLHHSTLINLWREYKTNQLQAWFNIRQILNRINLFNSNDTTPLTLPTN